MCFYTFNDEALIKLKWIFLPKCVHLVGRKFSDVSERLSFNLDMFKPSSNFLSDHSKAVLLLWIFLLFVFRVCLCYTFLSVSCGPVVTCLEIYDLLALLCVMFTCVFITFPNGVLGQVWCFIVSIPDIGLLPYFKCSFYQMYGQVITNWLRPSQKKTPNTWNLIRVAFFAFFEISHF